MGKKIYDLLLRAPDTALSDAEKRQMEETFRFKPFFSARLMARMEKAYREEREWLPGLTFAFNRVALPVLAFTLLLMAVIIFREQTFTLDALTGVAGVSVEDIVGSVFVSL
ncbi:MAG: hypothetical protein SF052_12680 [Bacteroidia bacterium]|nr:hypothetical protein [Bacteroidia bacterium]